MRREREREREKERNNALCLLLRAYPFLSLPGKIKRLFIYTKGMLSHDYILFLSSAICAFVSVQSIVSLNVMAISRRL